MDFLLATLCGIIVTTMNVFNGQLSDYTGVYLSTVIIHLVGLVTFLIIMKIKDKKVCFKKQIPLYMYCKVIIKRSLISSHFLRKHPIDTTA